MGKKNRSKRNVIYKAEWKQLKKQFGKWMDEALKLAKAEISEMPELRKEPIKELIPVPKWIHDSPQQRQGWVPLSVEQYWQRYGIRLSQAEYDQYVASFLIPAKKKKGWIYVEDWPAYWNKLQRGKNGKRFNPE